MCQPPRGGRNADKGLSDGLERIGGESRGFHGAVDETAAERNLLEGYWAEKFIEYTDGAESLTEIECKNEEE